VVVVVVVVILERVLIHDRCSSYGGESGDAILSLVSFHLPNEVPVEALLLLFQSVLFMMPLLVKGLFVHISTSIESHHHNPQIPLLLLPAAISIGVLMMLPSVPHLYYSDVVETRSDSTPSPFLPSWKDSLPPPARTKTWGDKCDG